MTRLTNRYDDGDASHLPSGMKRVGYDEDTERYTFREGDDLWLGEPGSLYGGKLTWAGKVDSTEGGEGEEVEEYYADSSDLESEDCEPERQPERPLDGNTGKELPHLPKETANDWGVPVSSISATGAKPPDRTGGTRFKDTVTLTVNAIRLARRRTWKRGTSVAGQQEKRLTDQAGQDTREENTKAGAEEALESFWEQL